MFHNSNAFGTRIIHILYIYSTNIGTKYFKHGICSPVFFSSKCSLFHNSNAFGTRIIHILYIQGVLKLKKINSATKRLISSIMRNQKQYSVVLHLSIPIQLSSGDKMDKRNQNCSRIGDLPCATVPRRATVLQKRSQFTARTKQTRSMGKHHTTSWYRVLWIF